MVRLCDYVPVLKSEITFDDGSECRKVFEIGAVHSNGSTMPTVTVAAEEMSSMKWLIEKWGSLGSYSPANNTLGKIRHAIIAEPELTVSEHCMSQSQILCKRKIVQ